MIIIRKILLWIGNNKELFGGVMTLLGATVTGGAWLIKRIWGNKTLPQINQTTHGNQSPVIYGDQATIIYTSGISLEDYEKNKGKIIDELHEQHKVEIEKSKKLYKKELEISEEKVKESQQKLVESINTQPLEEKLKIEITSLIKKKKYDEAEPLIYYLLLKNRNDPGLNYLYATIKQLQLNYSGALTYYEKAVELAPLDSFYLHELGIQYDLRGEYEKGLEYYQKALNITLKFAGENHPQTSIIYSNIGESLRKLGKYEKAMEYFQKALYIDLKIFGDTLIRNKIKKNSLP